MRKKYFIKTFGCQMNRSDSERLATVLEEKGFQSTGDINLADLVVFNTCGVRKMAEDRAYGQIHNLKNKGSNTTCQIVFTGCLSDRNDIRKKLQKEVALFFSIHDLKLFQNWLNQNYPQNPSVEIFKPTRENIAYLSIQPKYTESHQAFVPIMTGCNNFCAYCVVPYARGREVSRPVSEVIAEIKKLLADGCKHIVLLGQNVNSYRGQASVKNPKKTLNFSQLLKKIDAFPEKFWISFFSSHPKDVSDEMIEAVTGTEKAVECFHLPLQAGNDEILRRMNRRYTADNYLKIITKIKKAYAKNKPTALFAITSDIIVGFPGENKKQFSASAEIMRQVKYDMVYFSQFSPRPGTVAWKIKDDVNQAEKERREKYLNEILKKTALKNNRRYLNRTIEVLIEKEKDAFYFGKTRTLKNIRLPRVAKNLIGKIVKAKITKISVWNLEGEVVEKMTGKVSGKKL